MNRIAPHQTIYDDTAQLWIGCLAAYNAGKLHGKWVDLADADTLAEATAEILKTSPEPMAEEHFIADYNNLPRSLVSALGEYPSFDTLAELAELLEDHDADVIAAAYNRVGEMDQVASEIDDNFCGEWDSWTAYVEDYVDSTGMLSDVPESLQYYFDLEAFGRDLKMDYDVTETASGVIVFSC